MTKSGSALVGTLAAIGLAAHATATPLGDTGGPDTFNLEAREITPDFFPFSRNVYVCQGCGPEHEASIVLPAPTGWEIEPTRLLLPRTVLQNVVVPDGVPASLDLIAEIPGDEFLLAATVLSGTILQSGNPFFGAITEAQVRRDTVMTYATGDVVHELVGTNGDRYVLFTIALDALSAFGGPFDHTSVGGLAIFDGTIPGFSYESRVLTEDLVLASNGLANVLGTGAASWQKIVTTPEPGSLSLIAGGLLGVGALRLRRSSPR